MADEVLLEIQKEVKKFGDDTKALGDSLRKDLEDVRKVAEEAKSSPETKAQVEALKKSVLEKQDAIQKVVDEIKAKADAAAAMQKRIDDLERKLNRNRLSGGEGEGAAGLDSYREFKKAYLAARGQLQVDTDLSDDSVNVDEIKQFESAFGKYARRGDAQLSEAERKLMLVGDDANGGYFVPTAMSARILSIIRETSPMRQLATIETIGTDSIEFPIDEDELNAGWVGETQDRPETSTPRVGVQKIVVHEMYAQPKVTQKMLDDASVNVEAWLAAKKGEKFGRVEANAFMVGDGVNKARGLMTYGNGTTRGSIERIASGHATLLTSDGLIRLMIALKDYYANGASWLMRRETVGEVMLLKDLNGQYMWRPGLDAGKPQSLLSYPVYQAADMATVGAGALPLAFGNFRAAYTIVDRLGISTIRDPLTEKPYVKFYSRRRVGGDVTNFEAVKFMVVST